MSVRALTLAFAARGLSPAEKLVLLALADFADDQMRCWPAQEKIADITELSPRTVWAALKTLETRKMLSRVSRKRSDGTRTTDVFTLHFAGELTNDPVADFAKSSRNPCENQSQSLPNPVATVATLTTFEPSIEEPRDTNVSGGAQAPARPAKRAARFCPMDWEPSPADYATADAEGFSPGALERQLAKFRDFEFKTPRSDWSKAFRNWLRTCKPEERFAPHERPTQPSPKFIARQQNIARSLVGAQLAAERRERQRAGG